MHAFPHVRSPRRNLRIASLAVAVLLIPSTASLSQEPVTTTEETAPPAAVLETPRADLSGARALVRERRYEEAVELLQGTRSDHPEDASLLLMLGELLLATNRPAEAAPVLSQASSLEPGRERIHFQLGSALAATGEMDAALEAFGKELANTEDVEIIVLTRLNRSLLLERQKKWGPAIEELEMVLQFQPDRREIYGDLASLYVRAGNLRQGLDALERGDSFGFRSAEHFYSLGAGFYLKEMYEEAAGAFRRTLEIAPQKAEAERSLAACLDKLGEDQEAIVHLRRYLELRPTAPDREKIRMQIEDASKRRP